MAEENILLEKIWRKITREQEVLKKLEKEEGQIWEDEGIVYMEGRIYILNNQKIQEQIPQENHNPADVGHPGQQQMLKLIKRNY